MITSAFSSTLKKYTKNATLIFTTVIYVAIWIYYAIDPVWQPQWWLDNYLVFAFAIVIITTYRKYQLSDVSYILIAIFLTLHAVGSHYSYSSVGVGYWVSQTFGFTRPNTYDRIVHFLFGALLAYPIHDCLRRYSKMQSAWWYILPVEFILSCSALYEIIEASVALVMPPEKFDPFVGLQGDMFDGYYDMLCALSGATISTLSIAFIAFRKGVLKT